jgi:hypothetical protein
MAEDYGIVTTKAASASTGTAIIAAIRDCIIGAPTSYWAEDSSITVTEEQIALKATSQGFGDADEQQILIRHTGSGVVQVGYAPEGGLPPNAADIDTSPPSVWTGMRNITGTTAGIGASITRVWVVQYRDQLASGPNPASSITILLGTATAWLWAFHTGRIIATDNQNDPDIGIFGDGLLTGVPRETYVAGSWIHGTQTSNPTHAPIIRTGETWWSFARVADQLTAASLSDVAGQRRLVPYCFHGFGRAIPSPADNTTMAGIIGQAKYVRLHRTALAFGGTLRSQTPDSEQVWRASVYDATDRAQYVLWGPETEVE